MTIFSSQENSRPMTLAYLATSQDVSTISLPKEVVSTAFCPCDFECEYTEYAFGTDGVDEFQNDKTAILVKLTTVLDEVDFTLVSMETGLEFDLKSGLYGEYKVNGFSEENELYTGVIVEWWKVLSLIGSGRYKIRISQESIGRTFEKESHTYIALPYDDKAANRTIRIKSTHDGYFSNGIDYTNLNWVSMIRLPAYVVDKKVVEDTSDYIELQGTVRVVSQIQSRTTTEWIIRTELLPSSVYNELIYDRLKANKIEISDYHLFAKEKLRNLVVNYSGVEGVEWISGNTKAIWALKFTDKEVIVKRNVK